MIWLGTKSDYILLHSQCDDICFGYELSAVFNPHQRQCFKAIHHILFLPGLSQFHIDGTGLLNCKLLLQPCWCRDMSDATQLERQCSF